MANKQLVFENVARDLTGGQFFDLVLIDGGTSYTAYIRNNAQPPNQPANAAQITSVGGVPLIAPSGGGDVVGLGTTGLLMKWTDGPNSVAGDGNATAVITTLGYTPQDAAQKNQPSGYAGLDANSAVIAPELSIAQLFALQKSIALGTAFSIRAVQASATTQLLQIALNTNPDSVFGAQLQLVETTAGTQHTELQVSRYASNAKTGLGANNNVDAKGFWLFHSSVADGRVLLQNLLENNCSGIVFGLETAAFPFLKRSGTAIQVRLGDDSGDAPLTAGGITLPTAGNGILVKEGANATMGTGVLNGATEVTIATTKVTASSRIFLSIQVPGGTPLGVIYVSSRIAGTSFGVKGAATDTSTFAWWIVEPA